MSEHYKIGSIILNIDKARQIRKLSAEGYSQRELGELFGVSTRTINDVLREVSWKEKPIDDS